MSLIIQACKKILMISLQNSGESGDKIQDEMTTTKHLVTCTMLVETTVHPGI